MNNQIVNVNAWHLGARYVKSSTHFFQTDESDTSLIPSDWNAEENNDDEPHFQDPPIFNPASEADLQTNNYLNNIRESQSLNEINSSNHKMVTLSEPDTKHHIKATTESKLAQHHSAEDTLKPKKSNKKRLRKRYNNSMFLDYISEIDIEEMFAREHVTAFPGILYENYDFDLERKILNISIFK